MDAAEAAAGKREVVIAVSSVIGRSARLFVQPVRRPLEQSNAGPAAALSSAKRTRRQQARRDDACANANERRIGNGRIGVAAYEGHSRLRRCRRSAYIGQTNRAAVCACRAPAVWPRMALSA
jgi:hypothetical protein